MEENVMCKECYVVVNALPTIISDQLKMSYDDVKKYVNEASVNLNLVDIKNHFNKSTSLREDNSDILEKRKYRWLSSTYEYFVTHIDILREKSLKLLAIVDGLVANERCELKDKEELLKMLSDLDIELVTDCISYENILRLFKPIIENISDLQVKVEQANNLDTYLSFSVNKDYLAINDSSFYELFPSRDLQVKEQMVEGDLKGYVPLSDKQKQELLDKKSKSMCKTLEFLDANLTGGGHYGL